MLKTPPVNPTVDDLKAVAKFILQTAYSDGVGSLTLERSENGFTGQFSDRTDPKKILEYDLSKSGGGWQLNYKALSGVEEIESDDFSELETLPIWNEIPFDFEEVEDDIDPADLYTEQAIAAAAPIFDNWLGKIESSLFDGAESLEEVRDRVESVYSDLDAADFAELMQSLLLSGYGAGRYTVLEETADDDADFGEDTLDEDIWLVFSEMPETATPITDKGALSLLKRLIDSVYLAGLTAIRYAYVDDNNNIRCGFEDRISAKQVLSFDAIINSSQISYGISEIAASEPIWDSGEHILSFAATPATIKPRNCNPAKSFQCGNSCQKIGRNCKKNPSAGQKQAIAAVVQSTITTPAPKTAKTTNPTRLKSASVAFSEQDFESWNTHADSQSSELVNRKKAGTLTDRDRKLLDNHGIFRNVLEEASTGQKKNFRGLKDADGNLQVAALIKKKKGYLSLEYLVTAPWNISGGDKRSQKGNGTAMMRSIIQESVDAGHGGKMKLIALEGSKTFYEKIGFTQTKTHKTQDGGSVYSMELSPSSAADFLSKTGG